MAAIGSDVEFLKKVKNAATIERLRDRARQDGSPRGYVDLCHALVVQGSPVRALSAAQEGLRRFPRSLEIADQLRLIWGQSRSAELTALEKNAKETLRPDALRALAEHYLSVEELDLALETARRLVTHHPDHADGPALTGRVLAKRFVRDHVVADGTHALEALRKATSIDPKGFEAHWLLADLLFYVGCVRAAIGAVDVCLSIKPDDPDAARLRTLLQTEASKETAPESELVRAVEDRDGPWRGYCPPETRETDGEKKPDKAPKVEPQGRADLSRALHGIASLAGVRTLAFTRDQLNLIARNGNVFEERRNPPEPMVRMATMFRGRISSSSKRLGIGAFQEAEITLNKASVLAFGGMNAALLVEVAPGTKTAAIVAACRDAMGSLDRAPGGADHA
jgi:tetratricopeptide (TPR) repeat protein